MQLMDIQSLKVMTLIAASLALVTILIIFAYKITKHFQNEIQSGVRVDSNIVLALLFGFGLWSYFLSGDIFGGDAHSHIARTWLYADIVSHGQLPIWTNKWYLGFPSELYYGFLYYLVLGTISAITGFSTLITTKFVLLAFHVASGIVLFRLALVCTNNRVAALFSALFFVYSSQHTGMLIEIGALPLSLVFLLVPILFITMERAHLNFSHSPWLVSLQAAALVSAIFFTHIQYGIYAVVCFGFVVICRVLLLLFYRDNVGAWALSRFLILTGAISLLLCGWFLVPFSVEKNLLVLGSADNFRELIFEDNWQKALNNLLTILTPSRHSYGHNFYMGFTGLAAAVLGTSGVLSRPYRANPIYTSYALVFLISLPLALTSRFVNIWFVVACLMSAWGFGFALESPLVKFVPSCLKRYAPFLLVALLLVDSGLTLVKRSGGIELPKFSDIDFAVNPGRLAVIPTSKSALWRSLDVVVTGRSSLFGGIPQASTKTHAYVAAICTRAAIELLDKKGDLSALSRDAFRMLNTSHLIVPERRPFYIFPDATPAVFALQAVPGKEAYSSLEGETWISVIEKFQQRSLDYSVTDDILSTMALQPEKAIAKAIVMHASISLGDISVFSGWERSNQSLDFSVLDWKETHTRVDMTYASSHDGFLQLAYSYFPYLRVTIDGKYVRTFPSALGLIVVQTPSGTHSLTIEAGVSKLRIGLLVFGIAGLLVIVTFFVRTRKKDSHIA